MRIILPFVNFDMNQWLLSIIWKIQFAIVQETVHFQMFSIQVDLRNTY